MSTTQTYTPATRTPHGMQPMQRSGMSFICDICGKGQSTRRLATCSRIRQQRESNKWAAYMTNVAAKRGLGKRTIARGEILNEDCSA